MADKKISAKQTEIYEYLKAVMKKNGYPPTVREICEAVNLKSTASVHTHLKKLEELGLVKRDPTKNRAIFVVSDEDRFSSDDLCALPIVGDVAAGLPLLAEQNIKDYFALSSSFLPSGDFFMLKVKGESMIGAGIFDGDLLIVKKGNSAKEGEICVALIDDSATVKYFHKEKGQIKLESANPKFDPIYAKDVAIQGTAVGVVRMF